MIPIIFYLWLAVSQLFIGDPIFTDGKRVKLWKDVGLTGSWIEGYHCPDRCKCIISKGGDFNVNCYRAKLAEIPTGLSEDTAFLDLSFNEITELKANSFAGVTQLKHLRLQSNKISLIHMNAFVKLIDLQILNLSENNLYASGGLLDFIFSPLTSLQELYLSQCGIEHINVKAFLNLTNLSKLGMIGNWFSTVPIFTYQNMQLLPNLRYLNLAGNRIQSVPFDYISNMSNLVQIDLSDNKISDVTSLMKFEGGEDQESSVSCVHDSIAINSTSVDFSNNDVSEYVNDNDDDEITMSDTLASDGHKCSSKPLHNVRKLYLSRNKIRALPANAFSLLSSLTVLVLARNGIVQIDVKAFSKLIYLRQLVLSGNLIRALDDFMFTPAISLQYCDLSYMNLSTFNDKAFYNLSKLKFVILDNNQIMEVPRFKNENRSHSQNFRRRLSIIQNKIVTLGDDEYSSNSTEDSEESSTITELHLDKNFIVHLTSNNFRKVPWLISLRMRSNRISTIHSNAFLGLVYLKRLDLSHNPIKTIGDEAFSHLSSLLSLDLTFAGLNAINATSFLNLTNLQELHLDNNNFSAIPDFVPTTNTITVLPNLIRLSMTSNNVRRVTLNGLLSLPKLQTLILSKTNITLRKENLEHMTNLNRLEMVKCKIVFKIFALSSSQLSHLALNESLISITQTAFEDSHMLKVLHMPKCQQDSQAPKRQTFRNLVHLEVLDISDTGITPSLDTFLNSTNIRRLNLNGNPLVHLDRHMFKHMTELHSLHLSNTGLTSFNYTSLPEIVWEKLVELDLSKNNYVCNCSIVWFRRFLRSTNIKIINRSEYKCEFPVSLRGENIQTLKEPSDLECFMPSSDWYLVFVVTFLTVFLFVMMIISVLFRFRWHVYYWQSILTTRRRHEIAMQDQREYKYDAFVIYCQQDSQWVIHELRPRLENQDNLRLCIHHRDWLGGRDITDQIIESIEQSRKCLLIVSNAFAASQWCHVELTMAQSRLFQEDRDNLVLVVLEEISECHVTPRLRLQMQKQTYIEWTDNVMGQQLFWSRLRRSLRGPVQSAMHSDLPLTTFTHSSVHTSID